MGPLLIFSFFSVLFSLMNDCGVSLTKGVTELRKGGRKKGRTE